jgi:hypothetical protein
MFKSSTHALARLQGHGGCGREGVTDIASESISSHVTAVEAKDGLRDTNAAWVGKLTEDNQGTGLVGQLGSNFCITKLVMPAMVQMCKGCEAFEVSLLVPGFTCVSPWEGGSTQVHGEP